MEKRFQIFISSTFTDLLEERQAVLKGILEIDHMPAGMELFPAADDSAWQLIKGVIESSDYYVLIVGGRYGSLDADGVGYTEKEYDYAQSIRRPVIALLHKEPEKLARDKTETEASAWKKLEAFRKKVEARHTCQYWTTPEELRAKAIVGLTTISKRHPAVGWIRADKVASESTLSEILALRNRVAELEADALARTTSPPVGTEELAQGEDLRAIEVRFTARNRSDTYPYKADKKYLGEIETTWNEIFAAVAPAMMQETRDASLRKSLHEFFRVQARASYATESTFPVEISTEESEIETCIVQLRALGLIYESQRKRSVRDTGQYWQLTPYGQTLMVQLRAIRRQPFEQSRSSAPAKLAQDED